jgi:hypothetical protein
MHTMTRYAVLVSFVLQNMKREKNESDGSMEKKHTSIFCYFLFHVITPLLVGYFIYLFFRNRTGITGWLRDCLRIQKISISDSFFARFFLFYFTDMLWAYAFTCTIWFVLEKHANRRFWVYLITFGLEGGTELFQLFGVFPGTFDGLDIVAEMMTTIIALFFL